jgi:sugar/nucleoside kinase (ribokinase family)
MLNTKSIHIAPIAGEISFEVVKRLRSCCKYLSIDPQGMTRRFDTCGKLTVSAEMDIHLLGFVDIYKSSFDEICILTGKSSLKDAINAVHDWGPKIAIVTMGAQGSMLSIKGEVYAVPIYHSGKLVDPTGAGDVFIGAFLNEYVRFEQEPFWCACVGSAAASLVIEGVGTTFFGEKNRIYRRALSIYNK